MTTDSNLTTEPPDVIAYETPNRDWIMWCEDCRRWHIHGDGPGHRVAHCSNPASRYYRRGYILTGGETVPAWVMKDFARKRPKGNGQ